MYIESFLPYSTYDDPMYIQVVPNRKSPPCILLREDHREGNRVVKKILANLTKWPPHIVEGLRQIIKKNSGLVDKNKFRIVRSLPHAHVRAVTEVMKDLGLPQMLHSHRFPGEISLPL